MIVIFRQNDYCIPCDEQQLQPLQQADCPSVIIPMRQAVTHALPPDGSHVVTVLAPSIKQSKKIHNSASSKCVFNY